MTKPKTVPSTAAKQQSQPRSRTALYVVAGVILSFLVLFALFRWERRNPDGGDAAE